MDALLTWNHSSATIFLIHKSLKNDLMFAQDTDTKTPTESSCNM